MTLTPADVQQLRHNATRRPRRAREPQVAIELVDGPLDNLRPSVTVSAADTMLVGWCVMTDGGCVQVLYRREGERFRFESVQLQAR